MTFTEEEQYEIIRLIELYARSSDIGRPPASIRRSAFYRLIAAAPAGEIDFRTGVGAGLGGIATITRTGMTTLTDAGAAGLPVVYSPTTNSYRFGGPAGSAGVAVVAPAEAYIGAINAYMDFTTANIDVYLGGFAAANIHMNIAGLGDTRTDGWLLAKGVGVNSGEGSEFIDLDESAAAAVGSKWRIQTVTAASQVAGRGGIRRYETHTTTPCVLDGWQNSYDCYLAYRLYTRFALQEVANSRRAIGFVDAVPAVGAGSLAYTNDAALIYFDTSVGGNYLLRTVVGGAAVDVDTGIAAVAGEFHQFDLLSAATKVITMYIDGTLRATAAAANCPLNFTTLRKVIYTDNIGAAVMSRLDIDNYFPVQSRHTAVTP